MKYNYHITAIIIMDAETKTVSKNINRKTRSMVRAIGEAVRQWESEFPKPAKCVVMKAELVS